MLCSIFSILLMGTLLLSCNSRGKKTKIGVLQLIKHPALDEANKGFIDALEERGYKDSDNIEIDQKNAQGKIDVANQIAGQFNSDKKDLIFAIATPSAQAAYNATKDIPIVFSAVTDPVSDGLVESLESSNNNVTGTSDAVNIDEQLELFRKIIPNAKTLGFIYTTSETNSVNQLKELKKVAPKHNFEIKEIGVANINEINQNLSNSLNDIDALYAPSDNNVAASYELVGKKCIEKNIPVLGAESTVLKYGGLVSKSIDYYELGKMAGEKAADIIEGKKPSNIKIETMKELKISINIDAAKKLNIIIPDEILEKAEKITGGV